MLLYAVKCLCSDILWHSDVLLAIYCYEHALSHVSVTPLFNSTILSDFFYDRNSLQGILFALVEWLMLSESALLINTYGSSFAVEAAHVSTAAIILLPLLLRHTATHAHHIDFFSSHLLRPDTFFSAGLQSGPSSICHICVHFPLVYPHFYSCEWCHSPLLTLRGLPSFFLYSRPPSLKFYHSLFSSLFLPNIPFHIKLIFHAHLITPTTLSSTLRPFISSKVHQIPLVSIWDGLEIHHSDIRQPLCGHALHFKEYSAAAVDILYREGTTDMREVRLRNLRKLCGQLIIWHL